MINADFRVAVVGLGKIGLPLAVQFACQGIRVIGADINPVVVETINHGRAPFPGEQDLETFLQHALQSGRFSATIDTTAAVSASNVVIVVVPLIVDHESKAPDFRGIDAATAAVGAGLRLGTLVCYETTLPVGTTRQRLAPALASASGLALGSELLVCFSPERVSSGRVFDDLKKYPKLVGGINEASTARGMEFYRAGLSFRERDDLPRPNGVWEMQSSEAAELAKLAETTYRDINIAFANELARHCDSLELDVGEIITATNSQPFSHIHQPGIAVGGHCIPVYPHLYLLGDPDAQLPKTSRAVNDRMPAYCVDQLFDLAGDLTGRRIAVLGLAYRGGVKETAFSGCWPLVAAIQARGAIPVVEDPLYTDAELIAYGLVPFHFGDRIDAVIVQADHDEYRTIMPGDLPGARAIVDGRAVLRDLEAFTSAGVSWSVLGRRSHRATTS